LFILIANLIASYFLGYFSAISHSVGRDVIDGVFLEVCKAVKKQIVESPLWRKIKAVPESETARSLSK